MSGLVVPFGPHVPRVAASAFVAPNATLVGEVEIAEDASVWFGAVLRADMGLIAIGPRTNVQDLASIHMTGGLTITRVGAECTIGHGAVLHGCTIGDGCLVGMGSILLDGVVVGDESVIAAGALVPPRTVIPPRSLVRGSPGKVVREANDEERKMGRDGARAYVELAAKYRR